MLTQDAQRVKTLAAIWGTPIVYHPGGWDDTVPQWMKDRVITERLQMVENGGWDWATDAEVSCYLYTASLAQPLGETWTQITLHEAWKQIPHLKQVLPDLPEQLTAYQESELNDLKRKIRNSQLKRQNERKKENTMAKRKIVLDEREGSVLMGVMQENCDPVTKTFDLTLEAALLMVPDLLKQAEEKWKVTPRNPAYVAPPAPKKTTPAPTPKGTAPTVRTEGAKPTEELPLLKGRGSRKAAEKPSEITGQPAGAPAPEAKTEAAQTAPPPAGGDVSAAAPPQKPVHPVVRQALKEREAEAPAVSAPQPTPVAAPASGEWEYYLEDGRGPYPDVQKAMDDLGIDKTERPHHARWDRLSTEFKKKIQRRAKAG